MKMFWYTVFDGDESMDFETFAEAEDCYHDRLMRALKAYQANGMTDQFEEDKKHFNLGIIRKELIVWPD